MKVLITGAAGQIGVGLAKRLAGRHELTLLDNLYNGYVNNLYEDGKLIAPFFECRVESPRCLETHGRQFNFDENNVVINDTPDISRMTDEEKDKKYGDKWRNGPIEHWDKDPIDYDVIIHLAAISSLPECESNIGACIRNNIATTASILDFARKRGSHLIFASTSAVYENTDAEVFTEDLKVDPKLYYSLSKKMCEDLIEAYRENYGLKVSVLRFFNVFGPDGDQNRPNPPLVNFVYRELNKDQAPILSGDGEQVRDFICIDDVVSMIDKCMEKKPDDVFNVCTGKAISVNQISKWVAEELGKEHIGLKHKEAEELWDRYPSLFEGKFPLKKEIVGKETTRYSKGSYQKAKDLLGWEPNLDIESEVKRVVREIKIKEDKKKLIKDKEDALAKAKEATERADRLVELVENNTKQINAAKKILSEKSLFSRIFGK